MEVIGSEILPRARHLVSYHVVTEGRCWAGLADGTGLWAEAGDVVVVPHGDCYALATAPGRVDASRSRSPARSSARWPRVCCPRRSWTEEAAPASASSAGSWAATRPPSTRCSPSCRACSRCRRRPRRRRTRWPRSLPTRSRRRGPPLRAATACCCGSASSCSWRSRGDWRHPSRRRRRAGSPPCAIRRWRARSACCIASRRALDAADARACGGPFAHGAGGALRRGRRPAADPVPRALADAAGSAPPGGGLGEDGCDRARGGLRVRGLVQPRVQEGDGAVSRWPGAGASAARCDSRAAARFRQRSML